MSKSIRNIADRYMMAATKGYFIHRSPNPRKQPSIIYISDGRNVIYLETGGRYKGKFVPIESAKMPPLSEMDSLPIGKTHMGIIIDGNIVSEIASVLGDPSYEVVAPSLGLVRDITYSAPFNPKQEWDMLIGQPIAYGEPTGIPEIDKKHGLTNYSEHYRGDTVDVISDIQAACDRANLKCKAYDKKMFGSYIPHIEIMGDPSAISKVMRKFKSVSEKV